MEHITYSGRKKVAMHRTASLSRCWLNQRFFSRIPKRKPTPEKDPTPVDFSEVMYGRRNRERADSLSSQMLQDRVDHKKKIEMLPKPTYLIRELTALGHGKKNRLKNVYTTVDASAENWMSRTAPRTSTGAGAGK
jgi:hypothetical protein